MSIIIIIKFTLIIVCNVNNNVCKLVLLVSSFR